MDNDILWHEIKGYEGSYKVSQKGDVVSMDFNHSKKEKKLHGMTTEYGYEIVALYKNGKRKYFRVHRLVAEAFIPNPDNKPQVNHIDGDKSNNNVYNLEWVNSSENQLHAVRFLHTKRCNRGKAVGVIDMTTGNRYRSLSMAAQCLGVSRRTLEKNNMIMRVGL